MFVSVLLEQGLVGFSIFMLILGTLIINLRFLSRNERLLWIFVLLSWGVGVSFVTWEHTKNTWFVLGLLAAREASARSEPQV